MWITKSSFIAQKQVVRFHSNPSKNFGGFPKTTVKMGRKRRPTVMYHSSNGADKNKRKKEKKHGFMEESYVLNQFPTKWAL